MSVLTITERFDNRRGSSRGVSSRESERVFRVTTDTNSDDGWTIVEAHFTDPHSGVSLPEMYDEHPNNPDLLCRELEWKQLKGPNSWEFVAKYLSDPINLEDMIREVYPDPTDRPCRVSGRTTRDKVFPRLWSFISNPHGGQVAAATKTAITNSAGESYDTLSEVDQSRWSHRFIKNYDAQEIPDWALWNPDSINEFPVFLFEVWWPQWVFKISEPEYSDVKLENGVYYREWSFTLDYKKNGWTYDLVDRGYNQIDTSMPYGGAGGTVGLTRIKLADGTYPTVPVLLDGTGQPQLGAATASPVTLQGIVADWDQEDFNDLPIDEIADGIEFSGRGED